MDFQKKISFLGSRLALNIYFWLLLFLLKHSDADDQIVYSKPFYYGIMLFYMLFFAALSYVNNLVFLPRLLLNKKKGYYFLVALLFILFISNIYVFFLKWLPLVFPGLNAQAMSIVMYPVGDNLSFTAILIDSQPYFLMMSVWVVIFTLLGFYHYNAKQVKIMQETINKHREAELNFLRNQMNPHFLFNTLNNLYVLSLKRSTQTSESILKLSTVLRYILYESNEELVSFETEKEIMQAYVDIELLRIEKSSGLNFFITSDHSVSKIPPLIWLPLLENMFKHTRMVDMLEVDFWFVINNSKLKVYCKNNISAQREESVGGIGLSNLQKRLELLYPGKHSISTKTEKDYFITDLEISLN